MDENKNGGVGRGKKWKGAHGYAEGVQACDHPDKAGPRLLAGLLRLRRLTRSPPDGARPAESVGGARRWKCDPPPAQIFVGVSG